MHPQRARSRSDVIAGFVGSLLVVAPLFGGNALLGLDVAVLPTMRVPATVWGLGTEVPRRGMWLVSAALLSEVVGGSRAVAAFVLLALTVAYVGVVRLCEGLPRVCRAGAGVLYAFSPFVFTRIGVGHLSLVIAMAMLPWALPSLLHPADNLPRAFRWGVAMALAGPMGGGLALVAFAVGIVLDAKDRVKATAVAIGSQVLWILPLVFVANASVTGTYADSSAFATDAGGAFGLPRLLAGDGFWARSEQVGLHDGVVVAFIGIALLVFALVGHRDLPEPLRRPLAVLAALGLMITAASELPVLSDVMSWLTRREPFTALREGQRMLPLTLLWMAPAVAYGAARLARGVPDWIGRGREVVPLALALVLAGPGFWGAGGRLVVADVPADWKAAREFVADAPGTVLVLPLHQHVDLAVAGGRRVLDPLPELFDSDVLSSTALELGAEASDPIDRRQAAAARAVASTEPVSATVEPLGVRWIAVLPGIDPALDDRLARDDGLQAVVRGPNIRLFRALDWRGAIVTDSGAAVDHHELVAPVWRVSGSGPATWHRSGGWGWMRGLESARTDDNGEVALPSGSGVVWYWPAIPIVTAQLLTAATVVLWRKRTVLSISDDKSLSSTPL